MGMRNNGNGDNKSLVEGGEWLELQLTAVL